MIWKKLGSFDSNTNGQMWSSYGKSIEDAMNGAIVDAFLYI